MIHGTVSLRILGNTRPDLFFGRAYILFPSYVDAEHAFNKLQFANVTLRGAALAVDKVQHATPITETIFVGNIQPSQNTREDLMGIFSSFGVVDYIRALFDHRNTARMLTTILT